MFLFLSVKYLNNANYTAFNTNTLKKTSEISFQIYVICIYIFQICMYKCAVEIHLESVRFSSVTQSCLTLQPHGLQHARPPCPSPTPGVHSNSCPLSQWYHPTISSSVIPFSCPQSFQEAGSFQMSQLFISGGQSIGVSASRSVLPMNSQDWSPLGWTG